MQSEKIQSLFLSLEKLERALDSAEQISSESENQEVSSRLRSYRASLGKQREIAKTLEAELASGNLKAVSRNISLIREHSTMIRDDAREILAFSKLEAFSPTREVSLLH